MKAGRKLYDYLNLDAKAIAKTSGLPFGMNAIGYKADFLKKAVESHTLGKLETGWGRIFESEPVHEIVMGDYFENKNLRLTLDYDLDADFFNAIISYCKDNILTINDDDLVKTVLEKEFFEINKSLHEEYWTNFNKQIK